jgi:uncharacterized membrane protein YbhN (UPF0104 family)
VQVVHTALVLNAVTAVPAVNAAEVPADSESTKPRAPESALSRLWTSPVGTGLRALLAILPLAYLAKKLDLSLVLANAERVGAKGIALSALSMTVSIALASLRWRVLLRSYGANEATLPSTFALFKAYLVGCYFNVLPSGVAGDVVRGWRVAHCVPTAATSYVVLLLERLAGLVGLLLIAGIAVLFAPEHAAHGALGYALSVGALGAIGIGLMFFALPQWRDRSPKLAALVEKIPVAGAMFAKVPAARTARGPLAALALSVLVQGLIVLCVAPLLIPLSSQATLSVCARIVPAVVLVTYVPLTPGGLGQREAAFAHFFGSAGVAREASVTASLLFFAVMLGVSLLGGVVIAIERVTARRGNTDAV